MVRGGDLLGDGVNIAARLESLAEPGGICLSAAAHEYVRKAISLSFEDLGPQQVNRPKVVSIRSLSAVLRGSNLLAGK
ncbi:adenylate/guanylate cyclase domain-containing protein [Microvirga ossetica]|uniref:adenylate/guanylate cyclase domain-containing protein n=1 Tax=Microvirga ossetica TaxID=1882682 RepID=UPI003003A0CF